MQVGYTDSALSPEIEENGIEPAVHGKGNILFKKNSAIPADGYELSVTAENTVIQTSNLQGFVCGAEIFCK